MRSDGSLGVISEEIRIKFTKSTQGYDIVSDKFVRSRLACF